MTLDNIRLSRIPKMNNDYVALSQLTHYMPDSDYKFQSSIQPTVLRVLKTRGIICPWQRERLGPAW